MIKENELFSHSAIVLPVKNVLMSIAFYTNKIGFTNTFSWGDPVQYAVIKRGPVGIHLTQNEDDISPSTHNAMYVFVHDVDAVYEEFKKKEVTIHNPIGNREYNMRDFDIKDPDGFIITFGKGLD